MRILSKFYYVTNIFDLHIFNKETAALLNFFENCTDIHFVSLFFLNERNITTSLLMIHLEYTVLQHSDLKSSSINKPFLNYEPLNMLFLVFLISCLHLLDKGYCQQKIWNEYQFLTQISKIHFGTLNIKQNWKQWPIFLGPK